MKVSSLNPRHGRGPHSCWDSSPPHPLPKTQTQTQRTQLLQNDDVKVLALPRPPQTRL